MGFLDRLFGRRSTGRDDSYQYVQPPPTDVQQGGDTPHGGHEHAPADQGDPAVYDTPGDSGGDSGGGGGDGGDGGGGGGD